MKKSILALFFLLLLLIGTCVYQKTYTLYELATAENNSTVQRTKSVETISTKKEDSVAKQAEKTTKDSEAKKRITSVEKQKPSEKPTFLEKIKTTVTSVMTSEQKDVTTEHAVIAVEPGQSKQPTLNTKKEEKEVVNYLLSVLDEQNESLAKRDEAENELHALIKRVLEDRRLAIEEMEKVSLDIDTRHQKRLKERETMSQNNTEKEGK
jgi:hypothetical protein